LHDAAISRWGALAIGLQAEYFADLHRTRPLSMVRCSSFAVAFPSRGVEQNRQRPSRAHRHRTDVRTRLRKRSRRPSANGLELGLDAPKGLWFLATECGAALLYIFIATVGQEERAMERMLADWLIFLVPTILGAVLAWRKSGSLVRNIFDASVENISPLADSSIDSKHAQGAPRS
jgi:hypothetical protein